MAGEEVAMALVAEEVGLMHPSLHRLGPIKQLSVSEKESLTFPQRQQRQKSV